MASVAPARIGVTSEKPPLELAVEVTDVNGTRYRWAPDEDATSRPIGLNWRTKTGEGFSDGGLTLNRRVDLDWLDTAIVNDVTVTGADGSIAYQGYVTATPRQVSDQHTISVSLTGPVSVMSDDEFTAIYVDRDLSAWGPMSARRRAQLLPSSYILFDPQQHADPTTSLATVSLVIDGTWVSPFKPIAEAWYDAGPGNRVAQLRWRLNARGMVNTTDAAWDITPNVAQDDAPTSNVVQGSDFTGATPGNEVVFNASAPGRFALFQALYNTTPAGGEGMQFSFDLSKIAVYGDHLLPVYAGEPDQPPGVLVTDVGRDIISRYCPTLDASGIASSRYVLQHLAYKEGTTPYAALLDLNKYLLWNLGVWENGRVQWEPADLRDHVWEVRTRDPGVEFSPQGPSVENTFNAVRVSYQDVQTGRQEMLTPESHPELADLSAENPFTARGRLRPKKITLSYPTVERDALTAGTLALADALRPKQPGTVTVRGHLRDRAGNWQQAWKVRAGDTVALTDFPNSDPRLIVETSYDDDSKTLTMTLDAPPSTNDAIQDRILNALQANGVI